MSLLANQDVQSIRKAIADKWKPIVEHGELPPIRDNFRKMATAILLENTEKELKSNRILSNGAQLQNLFETSSVVPTNVMGASSSVQGTGNIDIFDPVLISLVRRSLPNLVAYDVCGVQPMTGPTGLIFALRSRYNYANTTGTEAFYNEPNTAFATIQAGNTSIVGQANLNLGGWGTSNVVSGNSQVYNFAAAMSTAQAEALGSDSNSAFAQMAFSIEKTTVTAGSRALAASYSMELAQDLKAIHGLDAETELANILSAEILAEINREIIRTINLTASTGCNVGTTTAGTFDLDVDSNGRWMVEKFKGLMFQLEREANAIAKATRRGKGNLMICSSDVAAAMQMAGVLDFAPALNSNNLQPDDTGNTFAGVLNGRIRVYIDPFAAGDYITAGYKGSSAFDAGLFYCPYVPLQMVRAVDQDSFQPKIGFKTRYGVVANPYAQGTTQGLGKLVQNSNVYYRRFLVNNLL